MIATTRLSLSGHVSNVEVETQDHGGLVKPRLVSYQDNFEYVLFRVDWIHTSIVVKWMEYT